MDETELLCKLLAEQPDLDPEVRKQVELKLAPVTPIPADEETMVLCGYWPSPINGSKLVLCSSCGTRCCIAPSTQEALKNVTAKVRMLCIACFQKDPPEDAPEWARLLPSKEELAKRDAMEKKLLALLEKAAKPKCGNDLSRFLKK